MKTSIALALVFAASLAGASPSSAIEAASPLRSHRHHVHQRVATTRSPAATRAPAQGPRTLERAVARPLVTNDSDGMSRDPEDCNKGCLDSSE